MAAVYHRGIDRATRQGRNSVRDCVSTTPARLQGPSRKKCAAKIADRSYQIVPKKSASILLADIRLSALTERVRE
jgi:hypothetical protein